MGEDNDAHKNNPPDMQHFFVQAVRMVFYRYFRYILLPRKAISCLGKQGLETTFPMIYHISQDI